ncbi:MAG: hypothetical protein J3R72DRAFT_456385 [Linnemannia gamsii]|nr:MAG: hypothetical protein J3R72DRAFT_456385 [Linnemannia gamsii]
MLPFHFSLSLLFSSPFHAHPLAHTPNTTTTTAPSSRKHPIHPHNTSLCFLQALVSQGLLPHPTKTQAYTLVPRPFCRWWCKTRSASTQK